MVTKHTPGPWWIEPSEYDLAPFDILGATDPNGTSWPVSYVAPLAEAEANARLIAAAPDLLDARQFALDSEESTLGDGGSILGDEIRDVLRAAIAKAEGMEDR